LSAHSSLSVAELWQGKGLAKLMLTKLERYAAAGGPSLALQQPWRPTKRYYRSHLRAALVIAGDR
jgi:GNAT superfamily N-acetyltransferase